jgi:hypothetical protein
MGTDPKPDDDVVGFEQADDAITPADASGVDRFRRMDALEVEATVPGVYSE